MGTTRRQLVVALAAVVAGCRRAVTGERSLPSEPSVPPNTAPAPTTSSLAAGDPSTAAPSTAAPSSAAPPTVPATTVAAPTSGALARPATFVDHGPRHRPEVALTFHGAGEVSLARRLLDVLAADRTVVTVFAVGQWLDDEPGLVAPLLAGGHELANHTYTHPAFGRLDAEGMDQEILQARAVLANRVGQAALRWFRPSGVVTPTAAMLESAGRAGYGTVVGYDVDSLDFEDPGPRAVVANVVAGLAPGAVISLHFGHEGTIAALPALLAEIRRAGLQPVTVSQLLRT